MSHTLTRTELLDLWRALIATTEAVSAGYHDRSLSEYDLDRLEDADAAARSALNTHLHLQGLTQAEIKALMI